MYAKREIMQINLKDIRLSGKTEEEFSFEFTPQKNLCDIPNVSVKTPISVKCYVTLMGKTSCYVEATITYTLQGECTTCLKEIEKTYTVEFEHEFSLGDEDGFAIKSDTIDLHGCVTDEVSVDIPISFTCEEGCEMPFTAQNDN